MTYPPPGNGPRNPYDGPRPTPSTRRRRPVSVIAATFLVLLLGTVMAGGCAYGLYWTWVWMSDAPAGNNRSFGGVLGIAFCLLGLAMGTVLLRAGIRMLLGRPRAVVPAVPIFGILSAVSGTALANGLAASNIGSDEWLQQMAGFGLVCVVMVTGCVLCCLRGTKSYFDIHPPRRPPARF